MSIGCCENLKKNISDTSTSNISPLQNEQKSYKFVQNSEVMFSWTTQSSSHRIFECDEVVYKSCCRSVNFHFKRYFYN